MLVLRGNRWWGLAVGATGLLFHTSAIAFIPMWIITAYLEGARKSGRWRAIAVVAGAFVAMIAGSYLVSSLGVLLDETKYAAYLTATARGGAAAGTEVLYRIVPILAGVYVLSGLQSGEQ